MKFGEKNIGKADKAVRLAVGLFLLLEAYLGSCALYSVLGINTCKK